MGTWEKPPASTRRPAAGVTAILALLILAPVQTSRANGNVSHVWVTLWALDHLPDGELRDLLTRDDLDLMLRNGANFPDGGYAVNDGYGEIAHWEPFQTAYLDWIADTFEPPWTDEAAQHIAFLMGMASHGMSDQLYDSMYLRRAGVYDEGSPGSSIGGDGSTDVCLTAEAGPLDPPELWLPAELMAELMVEAMGHTVDASTISDGQELVAFSIYFVSQVSQDPEQVAEHREAYPWACDHQMDEGVPGSPPTAAPVIAVYWQRLWDRLHGQDPIATPLMASYPEADGFAHPHDADDIESMVTFVVSRGLNADSATPDSIAVKDEDDAGHLPDIHVYYGHASHVVNLHPTADWTEEAFHTVSVDGLETWDGEQYAAFAFEFTTADPGVEPPEPEGCGCSEGNGGRPRWPVIALVALVAALRGRRGSRRPGRRSRDPGTPAR